MHQASCWAAVRLHRQWVIMVSCSFSTTQLPGILSKSTWAWPLQVSPHDFGARQRTLQQAGVPTYNFGAQTLAEGSYGEV